MTSPLIEIENVSQAFGVGDKHLLACRDINLTVNEGEFVAIVGPSGCGKSTLLNMVAGLLRPTSGRVLFRGQPIVGPNTEVGYLTQRDTLLPWRTIEENVALALEIRGVAKSERVDRAQAWLKMVGLDGFENRYPRELSGGMRRRAILARTLVYEPRAMMMDEPFGALDSQLRIVMHEELMRVWEASRSTVLFVTHDLGEAITLADRVVVFTSRPGTIAVVKSIDLARPRDAYRLRFQSDFSALNEQVWGYLEQSVKQAGAAA